MIEVKNVLGDTVMTSIPGIPQVGVYDENDNLMFTGWYAFHKNTNYCFSDDYKPEYYDHLVIHDDFADWGMKQGIRVTKVTPPHYIKILEED